ncbi:8186_t:CDS:1, partial [Acaulospora morrowiae]
MNLNSTSPEFRQKLYGYLTKLFTRIRGNLYALWRDYNSLLAYIKNNNNEQKIEKADNEAKLLNEKINNTRSFLDWLVEYLAASLYPGASFQRISCALKVFFILVKTFGIENIPFPEGFVGKHENNKIFPFDLSLATQRNVELILYCLMNPFDENRMLAYEILEMFPSPLPGIESPEK